eukprot:scaffold7376_cov72-Skeletonema_dohrnii-CCMP3373.AAC.1
MDPPAVDKYLSRPTSTSNSRLWRSSKNAPVTGTVKGERQRLNYRCYCSQNGQKQNKTFRHRLCIIILSALAPFVCFQFYFLYKLTNGKDATERIAFPSAPLEHIKVFYNVYANPDDDVAILRAKYYVNEQMAELLPKHQVFIRSIGKQFEVEDATQIQHDEKGDE